MIITLLITKDFWFIFLLPQGHLSLCSYRRLFVPLHHNYSIYKSIHKNTNKSVLLFTRLRQATAAIVSEYIMCWFIFDTIFIPITVFDILQELGKDHTILSPHKTVWSRSKHAARNWPFSIPTSFPYLPVHPFIPLPLSISFDTIYIRTDRSKRRKLSVSKMKLFVCYCIATNQNINGGFTILVLMF